MKKVLITGSTGFVGDHVVQSLLDRDLELIATSTDEEKAGKRDWFDRVRYITFDFDAINNETDYFNFFGRPDIMVHLAWEGLPQYRENFHLEINFPRHLQLLQNMIKGGLRSLTVTGTCFEYGMQEGLLNEEMETFPGNPYGLAKDRLRRELDKITAAEGVDFKWVRLFYMYGKGQNPKSLLSQLENAVMEGKEVFNMSGGEQVRDYMPVEEVASAIASIALQEKVSGIINCCSGNPVKIKEFVSEYLNKKQWKIDLNLGYYPYPDYEPMRFWGDNSKLKKILENE